MRTMEMGVYVQCDFCTKVVHSNYARTVYDHNTETGEKRKYATICREYDCEIKAFRDPMNPQPETPEGVQNDPAADASSTAGA